jgi:hypothetical protein
MRCVILQPSYIPWRGFFDQVDRADVFVFYDDVQYDKRGWRNRNRIKTPQGVQWLTIPVHSRGSQTQHIPISDIQICWDTPWNEEHWDTLKVAYHHAPYFHNYQPMLEEYYHRRFDLLSDFTIELTMALAQALGITHTQFVRSSTLSVTGTKTDRLLAILQKLGATEYISGPSAQDYIEADKFTAAGITLEYMQYNYPAYEQFYPPYDPQVSILDLLFMTGPNALDLIRKPHSN